MTCREKLCRNWTASRSGERNGQLFEVPVSVAVVVAQLHEGLAVAAGVPALDGRERTPR
jgi:hypothetical protein